MENHLRVGATASRLGRMVSVSRRAGPDWLVDGYSWRFGVHFRLHGWFIRCCHCHHFRGPGDQFAGHFRFTRGRSHGQQNAILHFFESFDFFLFLGQMLFFIS